MKRQTKGEQEEVSGVSRGVKIVVKIGSITEGLFLRGGEQVMM
jgi:hypothetical protein